MYRLPGTGMTGTIAPVVASVQLATGLFTQRPRPAN
jgi:hypothetical protein